MTMASASRIQQLAHRGGLHVRRRRSPRPPARARHRDAPRSSAKKSSATLAADAVDQPRPDLRELAADLRLRGVVDAGALPFGRQRNLCLAVGKARGAALPFEAQRVRIRRSDVGEIDAAVEFRGDGADARGHHDAEFAVRDPLDDLAAGDAGLERVGIVERLPGLLDACGDDAAAFHFHGLTVPFASHAALRHDGARGVARDRRANAPASCLRLSRLCTGRNSSTYGSIARMPAGRGSKPS